MSEIILSKKVYLKSQSGIINNQFSQLLNNTTGSQDNSDISVDDFFVLYDNLFYQIPKLGDVNSHTYILNREADYLGVKLSDDVNVQALLDEITSLRQELLDTQQTINDLTKA